MSYDFDKVINRRETNSYKWDVADGELPMWVADMDFNTAPAILAAVQKRLDQGVFGYSIVSENFKNSIISWWRHRHNWNIDQSWILFCTGAIPAISSVIRKMTDENDNIVVMAPVYNVFYNSILNNNRTVLVNDLQYSDGEYSVNFIDLEEKLSRNATKLLIFCNPHNPIGKVWSKTILTQIGELCIKYNVLILSDELHCDLTHKGYKYRPMASISERIAQQTITCVSPSKTFNLAGLQTSAIIIPNEKTRLSVDRGINTDEVAEPNAFAIQVTESAFNEGEDWLNCLLDYLEKNRKLLEHQILENLPEIKIVPSSATYLAWLDCSKITQDTECLCHFIRQKTGLYLSEGEIFGGNGGQFIRWNYACPKVTLEDGIQRFIHGVRAFREKTWEND